MAVRRIWFVLLAALIGLYISSGLFGEELEKPDPSTSDYSERDRNFDVTDGTEVFVDPQGKYSIRSLLREESRGEVNFVSLLEENLGLSTKTYWFKLKLTLSGRDFRWLRNRDHILEFHCPYINKLDVYLVSPRTRQIEEKHSLGRTQLSGADSPPPYRNPTVSFSSPWGKEKIVYIRAKSTDNIFVRISLYPVEKFVEKSAVSIFGTAIIYGIVISMIVFNGIFLVGSFDKKFIVYIIYLSFLLLYLLSQDGVLFQLWAYKFPYFAVRSNYFFSIASIVFLLLFTRLYLETNSRYPVFDKLLLGFVVVALVLFSFYVILSEFKVLLVISGVAELAFLIALFSISVKAALNRQKTAYYFLSSWGVLIFLVLVTQLRTLGLLSPNFLTTQALSIGAAFQVVLLTVGLADRVNTLNRENLELKIEKNRIEEEYRQKTDFFINVSHELRTPLTLINGLNKEIMEGEHGKVLDCKASVFSVIERNTARIRKLVRNISELVTMDHKMLKPRLERGDLLKLISDLSTEYRGIAEKKRIYFSVLWPPKKKLQVKMDPELMRTALRNLLSNAFQYTDEGAVEVLVESREEGKEQGKGKRNSAVIRIRDTGIGIAKKDEEKIFQRFVRLTEAQALREEGLGVGLALVKEIVELHEGKIKLGENQEKGAEFILQLPLANEIEFYEEGLFLKRDLHYSDQLRNEDTNFMAGKKTEEESVNRPLVLIVEDDTELLDYLHSRLRNGFSVVTAVNGAEAVELIKDGTNPDVIVSDIMMPVLDGKGLFKTVQEDEGLASVPFIFLTARDLEEERISLIKEGAVDYITKPFDMDLLKAKILTMSSLYGRSNAEVLSLTDSFDRVCSSYSLTPRQREVTGLLLQGKSKKEIARELKNHRKGKGRRALISVKTADNHIQKIYRILDVHSQYELISKFLPPE